jgi:hypothetical protein
MHRRAGRTHPTRVTNAVTSLTDARMSVTSVLTSRAGAPVSLVGAPLRETHASFTLVTRVVRVIRAATGVEDTPSRTLATPLGEEGTRDLRCNARRSRRSPRRAMRSRKTSRSKKSTSSFPRDFAELYASRKINDLATANRPSASECLDGRCEASPAGNGARRTRGVIPWKGENQSWQPKAGTKARWPPSRSR